MKLEAERCRTVKDTVNRGTRKNEGYQRGTGAFQEEDSDYYMEKGLKPDKTDGSMNSYEAFAGARQYSDLDQDNCISQLLLP